MIQRSKVKHIYRKFPTDFNTNYISEIKHFISCCKGEETPIASLAEGIETMELILSAYKSVETGSIVRVG